jgi:TetR/AcrR family tetracycline transcriptional repressor
MQGKTTTLSSKPAENRKSAAGKRKTGRRPRPALTREAILEAGLSLLVKYGGAELSMRSLADELGTAPMSLYRHVRNREDLLDGINRLALGSMDLEVPEQGDWKMRTRTWMHALRREMHAHPAVAPLLRLRGSLAPALLRALNSLLRIMLDAGFEGRDAVLACREVIWFTMAFVTNEIRNQAADQTAASPGTSTFGSFEHVSAANEAEFPELALHLPYFAEMDVDEVFAVSTEHILAGLEAMLDAGGLTERPTENAKA